MSSRASGFFAGNPGLPARILRALLLVGCAVLALLNDQGAGDLGWIVAIGAVAVAVSVLESTPLAGALARTGEVLFWAIAVHETGRELSPLLPYVLAPVFAGGLLAQATGAAIAAGAAAAALLAAIAVPQDDINVRDYSIAAAQWTVIALMGGLVAAWARRLQETASDAATTAYDEAHSLLSQLYTVTRQLPGSLDPVTTADGFLEELSRVARFSSATVVMRSDGERLVPIALRGEDRLEWAMELDGENAFAEAWESERPRLRPTMFGRGPSPQPPPHAGAALVVPILIGGRCTGLVGMETEQQGAYTDAVVAQIAALAEDAALRLETGMLFEQIREIATAEERRRLAREIHDGIAQELASLGYIVDEISAVASDAGQPDIVDDLRGLRHEMTRIVRELRLSIFDLRSEVDQHGGLGAALSDYIRTIGKTSGFTVHLTLDEGGRRLPAETEAELLRIAQEAINNARKHSTADNLWVTCRVHPPRAELIIEDDGRGLGKGREDSYGLEIMRERAARTRATLEIRAREPAGTYVGVRVGPPAGEPVTAPDAESGEAGDLIGAATMKRNRESAT